MTDACRALPRIAPTAPSAYQPSMLRMLAALLIVFGLAFAPATMANARVMAAPSGAAAAVHAAGHCNDAAPTPHHDKSDAKPACSGVCPMAAALPLKLAEEEAPPRSSLLAAVPPPAFFGIAPEGETPPPRIAPEI